MRSGPCADIYVTKDQHQQKHGVFTTCGFVRESFKYYWIIVVRSFAITISKF